MDNAVALRAAAAKPARQLSDLAKQAHEEWLGDKNRPVWKPASSVRLRVLGVPVVMPTNLVGGDISEDGIARIDLVNAYRLRDHALRAGDIVYGRRGDIGRKAMVGVDQQGWICGTGCLKLRLRAPECPSEYLYYYLDLPTTREWISARAIGATMPNLNTTIVGEVEVPLPGENLCSAFATIVAKYRRRAEAARHESSSLIAMRTLLLPRLMSGEIRVRDAERIMTTGA